MKGAIGDVSPVADGGEGVREMDDGVVVGDRKNPAGVADEETAAFSAAWIRLLAPAPAYHLPLPFLARRSPRSRAEQRVL